MLSFHSSDFEVINADFIALDSSVEINANGNVIKTKECQRTKCGELFMSNNLENLDISLKCFYCSESYSEIKQFTQHLINEHLSLQKIYPNEETIVNPTAPEDGTNELEQTTFLIEKEHLDNIESINNVISFKESYFANMEAGEELQVPLKENLPFKCMKCPKSFKTKYNMETHVHTHSENKPFQCKLCPRSYANKQNLVVHLRRHNDVKPFKCDQCFRNFATSTEKKIHLRSHTGQKPYICLECVNAYATASQLLEHRRRIHLDERNFKCDVCHKAFHTKNHLKSHQQALHTTSSYVCGTCNLSYKTEFYLKAHMKIHCEKTYKCMFCEKKFAQHSGLYQHRKTHIRSGELDEKLMNDERIIPCFH